MSHAPVIVCRECDLIQLEVELSSGGTARCRRCNAVLYRNIHDSLNRTLACALAAALLYVIANAYPLIGLELQGSRSTTTLYGSVQALWNQDMRSIALLVFITAILAPAAELTILLYLLLSLKFRHVPAGFALMLRVLQTVKPWNMIEIFMLGVLVSLVKLADIASVIPGIALWSFGGLTLMLASSAAFFDIRTIWNHADKVRATTAAV